ncbi:MAG: hypothetical protein VX130_03550 [Verrucomicrobiota bacterium]|nr:hypothetical protein [Verrucomicrobiota bacterium]
MTLKKRAKKPLEIGDFVMERKLTYLKRRVGEIIFIREGKRRKFELQLLNRHDLSPVNKGDLSGSRKFSLFENECKRLNMNRYQSKKTFEIGDVVRLSQFGRLKFGQIVGFVHPEGLYTDSYEKGYNGKDFLECIEISGRAGLPRKIGFDGHPKTFIATAGQLKICEVIPMDLNGGLRIKGYWDLKRAQKTK